MIDNRIYDYAYRYLNDYISKLEEDISKADTELNSPEVMKFLNQRLVELKEDLEYIENKLI